MILVLNLGLKSIRAIVFDYQGNKIANSSMPVHTSLGGKLVEQSALEWILLAKKVIKDVLRTPGISEKIRHMTVTSSSSCLIGVDEEGRPLHPAIMVSDKRAEEQAKNIEKMPEFKNAYKKIRIPMDPYLMLPKIVWVKENNPEVFKKAVKFLSPNDFFIAWLTGENVSDYFNAEKYLYDIIGQRYPEELYEKLGISIEQLPKVITPGQVVGKIRKEIYEELGFKRNVEVVLTTYDALCAFFGSGVAEEGEACDVSGTVTSFRVFSRRSSCAHLDSIFTQPFGHSGIYIVGGSNNLGGGLIEWLKQCFYCDKKRPYEKMEQEAMESTPGAGGLIFLPYLMGERAPIWDTYARGAFFGLERFHTRKDITRAVFESAGFSIKSILKIIEENGIDVKDIRVSGGLSRLKYISQLKADITGKKIKVVEEFETTSLGALIVASIGLGIYEDFKEASNKIVKIKQIVSPNIENFEKYQEIYNLFCDVYKALKPLFKERSEMNRKLNFERIETVENL
jgi:sugar (pentulose or hexulose) kinase